MNKTMFDIIVEQKQQFHRNKAHISFEEKIKEIIALQKIDMEFSKHRKTPRAPFMKVWDIKG